MATSCGLGSDEQEERRAMKAQKRRKRRAVMLRSHLIQRTNVNKERPPACGSQNLPAEQRKHGKAGRI
jgi:hypothetical protein